MPGKPGMRTTVPGTVVDFFAHALEKYLYTKISKIKEGLLVKQPPVPVEVVFFGN